MTKGATDNAGFTTQAEMETNRQAYRKGWKQQLSFKGLNTYNLINRGITGPHLLLNTSGWSLRSYVIFSIWWMSHTFPSHTLYEGGSGFSQLIVMHFRAAVSNTCNKYVLGLPSKPSGVTPSNITMGSSDIV